MATSSAQQTTRRVWPVVISIVVFAALMALRYELVSVWARAAVAGCAFAVIGWGIATSWRSRT